MRNILIAVGAGWGFTALVVSLATIPRAETGIGKAAIYLLSPGILAGFAIGNGRTHDLSFWVATAILNAVFYSLLAYVLLRLLRMKHRWQDKDTNNRARSKTSLWTK